MNRTTCIGCGLGTAGFTGEPENLVKMFGFQVPVCGNCRDIAGKRREDIVAAITEVLRS